MIRNIFSWTLNIVSKQSHTYIADCIKINRQIHCGICLRNPRHTSKSNSVSSPAIASKYQVITDSNSPVIEHTVDEMYTEEKYSLLSDEFDGINLESKNEMCEYIIVYEFLFQFTIIIVLKLH